MNLYFPKNNIWNTLLTFKLLCSRKFLSAACWFCLLLSLIVVVLVIAKTYYLFMFLTKWKYAPWRGQLITNLPIVSSEMFNLLFYLFIRLLDNVYIFFSTLAIICHYAIIKYILWKKSMVIILYIGHYSNYIISFDF